ncbi:MULTISPECIES: archaellin/type IV pilin N-terminal domain-containing protein [unclassified Methanosarcina]|uniref:archaellin/type IV pilin N-terminal domain-containing protein n=1 Tax=unclassified Methanosarcina TaxID=2644672 RepID=UPI000615BDB5|nr:MULTISPECIES: archaellin/type IV pilin N-terminal domain-containing protein [unclassified Methanosarcina]AKB17898.1 Flagellin FlaB1 [Methanosarcina sp. WWM596]AKB21236.1 Flagellin FlaB1 [Methanosarcina sp. WH1]
MKGISNIFRKDEKAFTGLESAIVLTAFVVVAAVFSYVILGAGFTTSDTAKATIDEGVKQTTSSFGLAGDVIAKSSENKVNEIILTLQLTAGQSPVDIGVDSSEGMLIISYSDSAAYKANTTWTQEFIGDNDGDTILEKHEKVQITVEVPEDAMLQRDNTTDVVNREFRLEVKPKVGAIVPISRITPPQIDNVMNLK